MSRGEAEAGAADGAAAAIGASLASLVAASGPLRTLTVEACYLRQPGMAPLFAALGQPRCALRTLDASWNDVPADFAAACVLPAVAANLSLRDLAVYERESVAALTEAMQLVRGRRGSLPEA